MQVEIHSDLVCPWCRTEDSRLDRTSAVFGHHHHVGAVYLSSESDPRRERGRAKPLVPITQVHSIFKPRKSAEIVG